MSPTSSETPLAVTVQRACDVSGLGPTSIWALLRDRRLEAVHVPGVRRTLISYASLERLLAPTFASTSLAVAPDRAKSLHPRPLNERCPDRRSSGPM